MVGFRQRVQMTSKAASRLSLRRGAAAAQSDDCQPQLKDHDDTERQET
jgi:hypothetical protein